MGRAMLTQKVPLRNGEATGMVFELQNAPLVLIKAEKGYLMCGYLDMGAANALGDAAAKVRGVSSIGDALKASIVEVSEEAEKLGVSAGISGKEALERFSG